MLHVFKCQHHLLLYTLDLCEIYHFKVALTRSLATNVSPIHFVLAFENAISMKIFTNSALDCVVQLVSHIHICSPKICKLLCSFACKFHRGPSKCRFVPWFSWFTAHTNFERLWFRWFTKHSNKHAYHIQIEFNDLYCCRHRTLVRCQNDATAANIQDH